MQHDWEKYFDTGSEYWEKVQKIYKENDNYPKVVVSGRNLHHKFMRSFSRLEGTEIDNDKENLVSLSEGDHFLVHYYLWKCTKTGFKNRTALPVRYMYKKAAKYLTDEIAEKIADEWKCSGCCKGLKRSEETKRKISEARKGKKSPVPFEHNYFHNHKFIGKENGFYGKKHTPETLAKISRLGWKHPEESKKKISNTTKKRMEVIKAKYKEHKENGGTLKWNEFQKWIKSESTKKS